MNLQSSANVKAFIIVMILSCLLLAAPGIAKAGIIYDNGLPMAPTLYVPEGIASDTDPMPPGGICASCLFWQEAGDEFTVNEGENVITGVRWWGSRLDSSGGICVLCNQVGEFTISIYEFTGDEPGDEPIYSYNTGEIAPSSSQVAGVYEYYADIDSVALTPGKVYLLSIVCHTGTPDEEDDFWRWYISADSGDYWSRRFIDNVSSDWEGSTEAELAFQLFGPMAIEDEIVTFKEFFNEAVDNGDLVGSGPGRSANGRLKAFENMLANAFYLIENGDYRSACRQLLDAYNKTDGIPRPPDFVSGVAATELAKRIQYLMASLGCF